MEPEHSQGRVHNVDGVPSLRVAMGRRLTRPGTRSRCALPSTCWTTCQPATNRAASSSTCSCPAWPVPPLQKRLGRTRLHDADHLPDRLCRHAEPQCRSDQGGRAGRSDQAGSVGRSALSAVAKATRDITKHCSISSTRWTEFAPSRASAAARAASLRTCRCVATPQTDGEHAGRVPNAPSRLIA